jgi:hypothetical protein
MTATPTWPHVGNFASLLSMVEPAVLSHEAVRQQVNNPWLMPDADPAAQFRYSAFAYTTFYIDPKTMASTVMAIANTAVRRRSSVCFRIFPLSSSALYVFESMISPWTIKTKESGNRSCKEARILLSSVGDRKVYRACVLTVRAPRNCAHVCSHTTASKQTLMRQESQGFSVILGRA